MWPCRGGHPQHRVARPRAPAAARRSGPNSRSRCIAPADRRTPFAPFTTSAALSSRNSVSTRRRRWPTWSGACSRTTSRCCCPSPPDSPCGATGSASGSARAATARSSPVVFREWSATSRSGSSVSSSRTTPSSSGRSRRALTRWRRCVTRRSSRSTTTGESQEPPTSSCGACTAEPWPNGWIAARSPMPPRRRWWVGSAPPWWPPPNEGSPTGGWGPRACSSTQPATRSSATSSSARRTQLQPSSDDVHDLALMVQDVPRPRPGARSTTYSLVAWRRSGARTWPSSCRRSSPRWPAPTRRRRAHARTPTRASGRSTRPTPSTSSVGPTCSTRSSLAWATTASGAGSCSSSAVPVPASRASSEPVCCPRSPWRCARVPSSGSSRRCCRAPRRSRSWPRACATSRWRRPRDWSTSSPAAITASTESSADSCPMAASCCWWSTSSRSCSRWRASGTSGRSSTAVMHAVSAADSRLRMVATLRADFYDRPLARPRIRRGGERGDGHHRRHGPGRPRGGDRRARSNGSEDGSSERSSPSSSTPSSTSLRPCRRCSSRSTNWPSGVRTGTSRWRRIGSSAESPGPSVSRAELLYQSLDDARARGGAADVRAPRGRQRRGRAHPAARRSDRAVGPGLRSGRSTWPSTAGRTLGC